MIIYIFKENIWKNELTDVKFYKMVKIGAKRALYKIGPRVRYVPSRRI